MAAAGDVPAGIFSGVWSRLHAAASVWRRRGQAPSGGDGQNEGEDQDEEEAAVRSRLARRAAAARRLGRKLAFVSFNLEVLVFVYAFWRARRRSLSWRLPTQALPILVIPALATLIYAAFVRFTRTLDLKDKKRLERLQEGKQQTDGEPRELDQNDQNNVQNCDAVDDASNSFVATDSAPHTPKPRKQRQSSINERDGGEADMAWGHSKDFQPAPSGGLRLRRLSSAKTYMTNCGGTERSEENTQKPPSVSAYSDQHVYHVPISTEDTVSYPSDDHSRSALSSMLAQPANIPEELPAGDGEEAGFDGSWDITGTCSSSSKEYLISPVVPHNSFCDRDDSRSSEHAVSYLSTAFQELLVKVNEEQSLSLPEKLEFSPVSFKEAAASPPDDFVSPSGLNDLSPVLSESVPPASETLKKLPVEGVKEKTLLEPQSSAALQMYSFTSEENPTSRAVDDKELIITSDVETYPLPPICRDIHDSAAVVNIDTVNHKWNLLLELYGNRVEETESSKFHIPEESTAPFNLEEVLPCPPSVNSIERCLGTPEFSLCSQESEKLEGAGSFSFIDDNPELSFLSSPELVVEGGEDAIEKESCELSTKEENAILINMEEEALQDPLIVGTGTRKQCLEASDISSCIQDTKAGEVPGIINFVTANAELMYPPSPELLAEDDEDFKEDKMSDLHLPEHDGLALDIEKEPILDSLVADTAEHLLVTPLYSEEVEITEVHDVVKEGIFESEGEDASNHGKLVVTPSDDDSNTQSLISDSMPVQFIPNTDINEALEGGQEAFSEPLHQSTIHSEGMFLSSVEINNDEVYSSNSNSYANVVDDEAPFEELSKFQGEMAITSPDTPIFLDEIKSGTIVDSDAVSPKFSLLPELLGGGVEENESSEFHVPGEIRTPFNLEEEVLLSPLEVNNGSLLKQLEFICQSAGNPEFSLCNQESEEVEVAGSVSFIKDNPELTFLSSPELVTDGGEDAGQKGTDELSTKEANDTLIILEDEEALHGELVVSTTDQCLGTSEFSLSSQGGKTTEGPGIATVSPEFNYPAFPELLTEGDADLKEDGTSELHLHEQKGLPINLEEPFLDPLVVDTSEDTLVTSELLICTEEVKMTEAHGVVQEVLSESEDEGAFDHQKFVLNSPDDDSTAQNLISSSISSQFLSDASVKEASQAGQEVPSEPPHENTCHSEGAFLSSGEISHDEVKVEAPFAGHEGLSKSEDEMALAPIDTTILLDGGASAESLTDNSGSSLPIPDINQIQSLHDHEVTSLLEGSHTSSDEGINSEIFSLYSRSSSCVSEINVLETLRGGATSEPPNDHDSSFDERNPVTSPSMDSTESNTDDPVTAEFILETDMIGTLNAAEEATVGSPNEVSSNFLGAFVAPDIINDMTESDKHLDLSSSRATDRSEENTQKTPSVSAYSDQHVYYVPISTEDDEEFKEDKTSDLHLSEQNDIPFNFEKEPILDSLVADTAEHLLVTPLYSEEVEITEVHDVVKEGIFEPQDPLSSEEILVYPDEGSNAGNDLRSANSSLRSTEVNLAEPWAIDQEGTQQHDETMLGIEDNSGSLDILDVITADSLRGASSEILYDGMSSFEGTLLSLDGHDNDEEDSPNNSGSVMHTAQIDTISPLGLQEGSFKSEDEKEINSISPYEADTEETAYSSVFGKDKEPKEDGESTDMKEDVEDLDDDHENNPIVTFGVDEITAALAPKTSFELYTNDASRRDSATGTSNDFPMAVRKPVATISNSNGSSSVPELADGQYTGSVDDDTETVGAPLPSSVATE